MPDGKWHRQCGRIAGAFLYRCKTAVTSYAAPLETRLTDREGHATFIMPRDGIWLLNVIWTKPLPSSRDTDFETVFSSLSFGFPPHAHDGGGDEGR